MVLKERIDCRQLEDEKYALGKRSGESDQDYVCRVFPDEGKRRGWHMPDTVFIRRSDCVVKELPRVYEDTEFSYDGQPLGLRKWTASERLRWKTDASRGVFVLKSRSVDDVYLSPKCRIEVDETTGELDMVCNSSCLTAGWTDLTLEMMVESVRRGAKERFSGCGG